MGLEEIFSTSTEKDVKREIVLELLDSENNLDEKTELEKPLQWACLHAMEDYIDRKKLPQSTEILQGWIHQSHRFLISKGRKGRGEYIQALEALSHMENKGDKNELQTMLGGN